MMNGQASCYAFAYVTGSGCISMLDLTEPHMPAFLDVHYEVVALVKGTPELVLGSVNCSQLQLLSVAALDSS